MGTWERSEHGAVAVLTFTRPPRNEMDFASMNELAAELAALATRPDEISVVLLASGDEQHFVAHADLEDLIAWSDGRLGDDALAGWNRALALLEAMPQVTIAAIDGQAWGGGNEIALACTLRVGSDRVKLGQPELRLALIPGAGATARLPRLIGIGPASEIILTGRIVESEEALRLGWLNAVLPSDAFREHALAWAQTVAAFDPAALRAAKRALVGPPDALLEQRMRLERELFAALVVKSAPLRARAAERR